jgi:hypothetical protein
MRTADLIELLARDARVTAPRAATRRLPAALAVGGAVTLALVVLGLHCQALEAVARQPWFWMKASYTGLLTLAAAVTVKRLSVPGTRPGAAPVVALLIILAMIALGAAQVLAAPSAGRIGLWLGHTWRVCSPLILLLALPIYGCEVLALRSLAPTRPAMAGAAAGLAAGALAATFYGLHCPEQAAAFVATWYTLGIAAATALGGVMGPRLLRW